MVPATGHALGRGQCMTKVLSSAADALVYVSDDAVMLSADMPAAQALSVVALQAACLPDGISAVAECVRVQLAHMTLAGGDPKLNREALALAAARVEAVLLQIEARHS